MMLDRFPAEGCIKQLMCHPLTTAELALIAGSRAFEKEKLAL
jgi:hypothetical protein